MAGGSTNVSISARLFGTAAPGDVKQGLTFSRDGRTLETGTLNLTNLLPENVKAGVNIGGVMGTYTYRTQTIAVPDMTIEGDGPNIKETIVGTAPFTVLGITVFHSGSINSKLKFNSMSDAVQFALISSYISVLTRWSQDGSTYGAEESVPVVCSAVTLNSSGQLVPMSVGTQIKLRLSRDNLSAGSYVRLRGLSMQMIGI